MYVADLLTGTGVMAKQTRSLIETGLYKKVGELVVTFGHLEDCFRYLVAGHLSPGIDGTICQGLFCRVRFAELVDMYLMVSGFVRSGRDGGMDLRRQELRVALRT